MGIQDYIFGHSSQAFLCQTLKDWAINFRTSTLSRISNVDCQDLKLLFCNLHGWSNCCVIARITEQHVKYGNK